MSGTIAGQLKPLKVDNTIIQILQGSKWAAPVYEAHLHARGALAKGQKDFLIQRDYDFFYQLAMGHGGAIVGAVNKQEKLDGLCAIVKAQDFMHAQLAGKITYPDDDFSIGAEVGRAPTFVIKALCTLDHARGKQLSRSIIEQAVKWCGAQLCGQEGHIFAEVDIRNPCSLFKFIQNGFVFSKVWTAVEEDGRTRQKALLQHASAKQRAEMAKGAVIEIDYADEDKAKPQAFQKKLAKLVADGNKLIIAPGYERTKAIRLVVVTCG